MLMFVERGLMPKNSWIFFWMQENPVALPCVSRERHVADATRTLARMSGRRHGELRPLVEKWFAEPPVDDAALEREVEAWAAEVACDGPWAWLIVFEAQSLLAWHMAFIGHRLLRLRSSFPICRGGMGEAL